MTTTIRAGSAARFLSLVPHLLGFAPTRSLVLVPFAGRRSLGAMRFDLPVEVAEDDVDRIASTCIGMVCRLPDATAVAIVAYPGVDLVGRRGDLPHADFVAAIAKRADACGIEVRDALCVGADAWASYLAQDGTVRGDSAPGAGPDATVRLHDLGELDEPPEAEVPLPPLPTGDQESGAALPEVPESSVAAVGAALAGLDAVLRAVSADEETERDSFGLPRPSTRLEPDALEAACLLDDLPELFEGALTWTEDDVDPYATAALAWCLARPAVRDIALLQWCGGPDDGRVAWEAHLRWSHGAPYPAELGMRMWGEGPRPDGDRLTSALSVARRTAALAPEPLRAGILAVCAWLSWALGRSTHADILAAQACEIEPEHGLGEIVRSFVRIGHLPDWAFRPAR